MPLASGAPCGCKRQAWGSPVPKRGLDVGYAWAARSRGPRPDSGSTQVRSYPPEVIVHRSDARNFLHRDSQRLALLLRMHPAPELDHALVDHHVQAAVRDPALARDQRQDLLAKRAVVGRRRDRDPILVRGQAVQQVGPANDADDRAIPQDGDPFDSTLFEDLRTFPTGISSATVTTSRAITSSARWPWAFTNSRAWSSGLARRFSHHERWRSVSLSRRNIMSPSLTIPTSRFSAASTTGTALMLRSRSSFAMSSTRVSRVIVTTFVVMMSFASMIFLHPRRPFSQAHAPVPLKRASRQGPRDAHALTVVSLTGAMQGLREPNRRPNSRSRIGLMAKFRWLCRGETGELP